jgi:hypothetical protein
MADQKSLRISVLLLAAGILFTLVVGLLHPAREAPNDHPAVFAEYAGDAEWTAVHLGQFAGFALITAGLLFLFFALSDDSGTPGWAGRFAAVSAVATLAIYGVLQAVDGVALKRAVDAWVGAPEAEKAAYFASAQGIRWLEEGLRSYYDFMVGLTFILFAVEIVWKARLPRLAGVLMGLTGIFYIAQGWAAGEEGFSPTHGSFQLPAYLFLLIWIVWLSISAWRTKKAVEVPTGL